jgi:hypothetical protein
MAASIGGGGTQHHCVENAYQINMALVTPQSWETMLLKVMCLQ